MDDEGRRCAFPGCGIEIQSAVGRPERRYCSAAHRAAARKARRAAMHAQQHPTPVLDLAETLPWLRDRGAPAAHPAADGVVGDGGLAGPVPRPVRPLGQHAATSAEPGAVARAAARRSREARREAVRPRRRRTLAALGLAGILAGGYAVTTRPEPPPVPVQTTPDAETADAWAQRASVALAAVNRQLDTLAQANEQWQQLPASRSGVVPAPVAALQERRAVLQRRRATLQSQLDTYRSMRRTQQDLADSEQHLQAVEQALAAVPPERRDDAAQDAAVAALDEQRDLRIRRRDTQRAELRTLEDGVAAAARTPLPDDSAATAQVSDDVLSLIRNEGRAPGRTDATGPSRPVPTGRPEEDGGAGDSAVLPRDERQDGPAAGPPPGPRPSPTPSPTDPADDTVAELHERAREVAREAQRAEAAQKAARTGRSAQVVPRSVDTLYGGRALVPGTPAASPPAQASVTSPSTEPRPAPALRPAYDIPLHRDPQDRRDHHDRRTSASDEAIEERGAARSAGPRGVAVDRKRSPGRPSRDRVSSNRAASDRAVSDHSRTSRISSDPTPDRGAHRAADPAEPGRPDPAARASASPRSGGSRRSHSADPDRRPASDDARCEDRARSAARSFDPHDGYLRLSRLLTGASSGR